MSENFILSEKLEDNKAAAEWGIRQAELLKKGEKNNDKFSFWCKINKK